MLTRRHALLGAISASTAIKSALAYPAKQVTLVVPFAPGAAADGIARLLGTYLAERMGIAVVVENKAGGGGSIGLIAVSRSNPDGQTIGVGATGAIAVNPHVEGTAHQGKGPSCDRHDRRKALGVGRGHSYVR